MGERSHQEDAAGDGSDVEEQGSIVRASPKSRLGETGRHKSRLTLELPSAVDPDKTRAALDRGAQDYGAQTMAGKGHAGKIVCSR